MTEDALAEVEAREAKRRSKKLKKKGKQGTTGDGIEEDIYGCMLVIPWRVH